MRVRVAGRLHEHAVAGADQGLGDHHQCRQGTGHDHDLRRVGGQPALVVRRRDRLLQGRQPRGEVAVSAEVRREVRRRVGVRRGDARAVPAAPRSSGRSTSSSPVCGVSVRSRACAAPAGHAGCRCPTPAGRRRTRSRRGTAYARVTVVRETARATLRSRSLGSRRSMSTRPSPISRRRLSASPRTPGCGRTRRRAWRAAARQWIPSCRPLSHNWLLMRSPISRHSGAVTTTTAPPPLVLSDLGPIAQLRAGRLTRRLVAALRRPGAVRVLDRADGPLRPRPGAVGRAALRPDQALPDRHRAGAGDRQLRGDAGLDPAARDARARHDLERPRDRPVHRPLPGRPARGRTRWACGSPGSSPASSCRAWPRRRTSVRSSGAARATG